MFGFFVCLSISAFIPYEYTSSGILDHYDGQSFYDLLYDSDIFVALIIGSEPNDDTRIAIDSLASISTQFSRKSKFGVIVDNQIPNITDSIGLQAPYLILFNEGNIVVAFDIPEDDNELLLQFRTLFDGPKGTARTIDELYSMLGMLEGAIISRQDDFVDSFVLLTSTLPHLGTCDLVSATDEVFKEIGAGSYPFAFFRRTDMVIIPFENNTQSLMNVSRPLYHVLSDDDFQQPEALYATIIVPQYNGEFHDMVMKIAQQSPDFAFGILTEPSFAYAEGLLNKTLTSFPDFAIFDYDHGYYFPTNDAFSGMEINELWVEKVTQFLDEIRDGKVLKKYISEEIPNEEINQPLHKVVGSNYEDFIHDNTNDVMMAYIAGDSGSEALSLLEDLAKELYENGTKSIKMGYINFLQNSSPKRFPTFVQMPHIEFYPAGQSESVPMFALQSKQNYLRFLSQYATYETIHSIPMTFEEAHYEISIIESYLPRMKPEVAHGAIKYIDELKQAFPEEIEQQQ